MKFITILKRTPLINILLVGIGFLLVILHIFKKQKRIEGFEQEEKFVLKKNDDIYDDFYVNIYDALIYEPYKKDYEVKEIINATKMNKNSLVLDVGSGIGHHVADLNKRNIPAIGLETSKAMIKKCRDVYGEKMDIKYANAMDSMLFETSQFTHIMCMFYTFYYVKSQEAFLRNCNKWLRHNGYLIIHIVNRNKFDPILPPSEIFAVSPQKFMKEGERYTKSLVKFNGYKYEADFKEDYENNKGIFSETFTDDNTGHIRKNVHTLLMKSRKQYEKMFLDAGFKTKTVLNLSEIGYHSQFLYILQKEN